MKFGLHAELLMRASSQDPENIKRLNQWFGTLPVDAFILATLCHRLRCLAGASVAMLLSGRQLILPALIVGFLFTLCGMMNLPSIPHPSWFPFVDLPIYLLAACAVGYLLRRREVHVEEDV